MSTFKYFKYCVYIACIVKASGGLLSECSVTLYSVAEVLLQVSTTLGPEIQLMICLPHACMTIVAALTDSGESQTLLLSMFRVP